MKNFKDRWIDIPDIISYDAPEIIGEQVANFLKNTRRVQAIIIEINQTTKAKIREIVEE